MNPASASKSGQFDNERRRHNFMVLATMFYLTYLLVGSGLCKSNISITNGYENTPVICGKIPQVFSVELHCGL